MVDDHSGGAAGAAARAWFEANWDPSSPLGTWWRTLADSGWGFPTWPRRWFGRDLDPAQARAVATARAEVGAFGPPSGIATMMVAPVLMTRGTPAQQERFLPPIADGSELWCQLFSEPGAGSDLAGVQARAVRDGDEWRITGQKVWTSGGHYSRWAILLARTDPDVPKHRGLGFFLLDMHQPGVEIRPLHQMNGRAEFNEVFLTDARVPHTDLLGGEGDGWGVALEILAHERASMDADTGGGMIPALDRTAPAGSFVGRRSGAAADRTPDGDGADGADGDDGHHDGHHDEEAEDSMRFAVGVPARRLLGELLDRAGRRDDPVARQAVAGLTALIEIARFGAGSIEPSTGKLAGTRLVRGVRDTGLALLGPHGTLAGRDAPLDGLVTDMALTVPSMSIAGGTDEIQRNVVGERVLGLPAEPRVDKHLPFRELPKA